MFDVAPFSAIKLVERIKNAPKVLYVKGDSEILSCPSIAIVGTRKATGEGIALATQIARDLASAGLLIVSGLAQGIDTAAHKGALEAGGKTIGVLGSSLEERFFFPSQNLSLARKMLEQGGAIVSEYEKDTPALKHHFVARNRIVSGLSLGVLVIEAPLKSGALITAEFARAQGRPVFAIPGSPFSKNAQGTNNLIKRGARLVENAQDIIGYLEIEKLFERKAEIEEKYLSLQNYATLSSEAREILKLIEGGHTTIDKISKICKIETSKLLALLVELELQGIIKNAGPGNYLIIKG